MSSCAILFSGGTDSLCSAALAAEQHSEVHLLTYFELATRKSPWPAENVEKLRKHYPEVVFHHSVYSTDQIVRKLSYERYLSNLFKHGFYNLATPGLSSLSWHIRTILYCLDRKIQTVYDGMTKELLHLPGHMPEIRELLTAMYRSHQIEFSSLVIEWDVPADQRFTDKLIVDRHGFTKLKNDNVRTTGQWLFEKEILPHPNMKGSEFDRRMQHDCYPFVVYNMVLFWLLEPVIGYDKFKQSLARFMKEKIDVSQLWISAHLRDPNTYAFLNTPNENA